MAVEIVNILSNESLMELAKHCAITPNYIAEVVTDKVEDAQEVRRRFIRNNREFLLSNGAVTIFGTPGKDSGMTVFQNNSRIIFRGIRQSGKQDAIEVLYENAGRAGSYGRRLEKGINAISPLDDSIYEVIESGEDDLLEFLNEFGLN